MRALLGHGFRLVDRDPEVVVCGLDRRLTYERLTRACFAIRGGPDRHQPPTSRCPRRGPLPRQRGHPGLSPRATGSPRGDRKPEATMLRVAMERLGATPAETAIVGDGLLTDILAGQRAGVTTILVLTGVSRRADLAGADPPRPDLEHLPPQEAMRGAELGARRGPPAWRPNRCRWALTLTPQADQADQAARTARGRRSSSRTCTSASGAWRCCEASRGASTPARWWSSAGPAGPGRAPSCAASTAWSRSTPERCTSSGSRYTPRRPTSTPSAPGSGWSSSSSTCSPT